MIRVKTLSVPRLRMFALASAAAVVLGLSARFPPRRRPCTRSRLASKSATRTRGWEGVSVGLGVAGRNPALLTLAHTA
jgi:hypothetical protein